MKKHNMRNTIDTIVKVIGWITVVVTSYVFIDFIRFCRDK